MRRLRELVALPSELLDLAGLDIRPFDYRGPSRRDGFDVAVDRMLAASALLFATPVYWYAMSGLMKTLFDRFTDVLTDRDDAARGRRLAGREMWMLAVGSDPALPAGFEEPFRLTAEYLEMLWRGSAYLCRSSPAADRQAVLRGFAERIAAGR